MNARAIPPAAAIVVATLTLVLPTAARAAGTVQQITSFGANPSGIGMYLYTPANVAAQPAIVVNVHACHGKGTDVCGPSGAFAQQADKYGFLVICPSAVSSDGCWDVHSPADLTHDGGGDASGIVSMVKWVIDNKNADASRVFVAGHSSGGMMTNVMLGHLVRAGAGVGRCSRGPSSSLGGEAVARAGDLHFGAPTVANSSSNRDLSRGRRHAGADGRVSLRPPPDLQRGLTLAFGWALCVHGVLTLVYRAALFVLFDVKSRREERWLVEKFSEYRDYQRRVRRLIPFLY